MSAPWLSVVEKVLDEDDSPVKNYLGKSDNKYGYLVITNKKIVFVHEKGLFRKSYELVWDVPLSSVNEFKQSDRYKIELNSGDKAYEVETGELSPKIVLKAIEEVKANN
jgi:hypothetical protein